MVGLGLNSMGKDGFDASGHVEDVSVSDTSGADSPPDAPINWPAWKRNAQILMVAVHSMDAVFMAAGIIPGYQDMAKEYGTSMQKTTYLTSVMIIILGVAPFFWIPITARYGRYQIFTLSVLVTMVCNIGGAYCKTFGTQMATRVLAAWFISPPLGIGSGVVTELSHPGERARKLGWWTLMITLGIPGSGFIMGFVVQHLGVAWIYWIFAIINAVQFIAYILLGDETLYVIGSPVSQTPRTGLARFVPRRIDPRPFQFRNFFEPLFLGRFPRILIPGVAYGIEFAYANIAIIVCSPIVFGERFHFNAQQIGYQLVSVIIGSVLGEQLSGPMSDLFLKYRRRQKGQTIPADRLWLSYIGFGTVFAGLLIWGFQLEKAVTWNITPCIGMAVAAFGNQVLTTILVSFAVDSHKEHAPSIGVFINFCRQLYGFCGPFYFTPMFSTLKLSGSAGLMCGIIAVASLIPVVAIHVIDSRRQMAH